MNWYQSALMWFGAYVSVGLILSLIINRSDIVDQIRLKPSEIEFDKLCSKLVLVTGMWPILLPLLGLFGIADRFRRKFENRVNNVVNAQRRLLLFLSNIEAVEPQKAIECDKHLRRTAEKKIQTRRNRWYSI